MKKEFTKKKMWIIIGGCVLALVLAVLGVMIYLHLNEKPQEKENHIYYYPIDYNENIFENKAYQSLDRDLVFSDSRNETVYHYETDYEKAGKECQFFLDYFKTVTEGKYSEYPSFFVDDFFDDAPEFTMQMIYDPYVVLNSTTEESIDGVSTVVYNFYVRYRILHNNGTFRKGVESGAAVPQIYQLVKNDDELYRILRILEISFV